MVGRGGSDEKGWAGGGVKITQISGPGGGRGREEKEGISLFLEERFNLVNITPSSAGRVNNSSVPATLAAKLGNSQRPQRVELIQYANKGINLAPPQTVVHRLLQMTTWPGTPTSGTVKLL
ncbi:hypothetical protein J6590_021138 [Homalodisca vitripennis]|nr:hypothetical protein J6590_021138 [Homalodisca vitripennis]